MRMAHSALRTTRNVGSSSASSAHTSMGPYFGMEGQVEDEEEVEGEMVTLTEAFAVMDVCTAL